MTVNRKKEFFSATIEHDVPGAEIFRVPFPLALCGDRGTQPHGGVTNSACIRIQAIRLLKFTTFVLFSFPGILEVRDVEMEPRYN